LKSGFRKIERKPFRILCEKAFLIKWEKRIVMSTSKEYLTFVLERTKEIEGVSHRAMMGEYVLYYKGKVIGGIYENRFLVKPTASAVSMMPDARWEIPYVGAKKMLLVDDLENREFLKELLEKMYDELPFPKKRK